MSELLEINEEKFIPARAVAEQLGYTADYVARLAREGKILGTKIGRSWYVDPDSVEHFKTETDTRKKELSESIRQERLLEKKQYEVSTATNHSNFHLHMGRGDALLHTAAVLFLGLMIGVTGYVATGLQTVHVARVTAAEPTVLESFAIAFYRFFTPESKTIVAESETVREPDVTTTAPTETKAVATTPRAREVVVILPAASATESFTATVRESFSDEVVVTPDPNDPRTGVLVPRFESGEGTEYRYVVVPVQEEDVTEEGG